MSLKRPGHSTTPDFAVTVRLAAIGRAELAIVEAAMAETAPEWSVELQGLCAEEATLVVLPEDGDDAMGPSFMISRETYGLRVDQLHWDVVTEIGVFASMGDVIDVLRRRLAFCGDLVAPASVTLH